MRPGKAEGPAGVTGHTGRGSTRTQRWALIGTARGMSWEDARPVPLLSLSVEPFPQPQSGEMTSSPQARAGAQAPAPERSSLSPRGPRRGGKGRRNERWGRAQTPRLWRASIHAGEPTEAETWRHTPKVSCRWKLLGARSPALWGPASPRVHTPAPGKRRTQLPPPGAFPEGGAKQKVGESGKQTPGP